MLEFSVFTLLYFYIYILQYLSLILIVFLYFVWFWLFCAVGTLLHPLSFGWAHIKRLGLPAMDTADRVREGYDRSIGDVADRMVVTVNSQAGVRLQCLAPVYQTRTVTHISCLLSVSRF
ncbi:hypothetical protein E1A91_D05G214100v1 [Gossypium mustelinum]|uniref:Uncharacterized protein n=1 Tax=Gossypium mustelinum TaxID=34275 RepID=A0A5D2UZ42_GOSMU|nr:hypothetical protein E1A91_D05G214100v1 [Gossypium mustelinum]